MDINQLTKKQIKEYSKRLSYPVGLNDHYGFTEKQWDEFYKLDPFERDIFATKYQTLALKELIKTNEKYIKDLEEV